MFLPMNPIWSQTPTTQIQIVILDQWAPCKMTSRLLFPVVSVVVNVSPPTVVFLSLSFSVSNLLSSLFLLFSSLNLSPLLCLSCCIFMSFVTLWSVSSQREFSFGIDQVLFFTKFRKQIFDNRARYTWIIARLTVSLSQLGFSQIFFQTTTVTWAPQTPVTSGSTWSCTQLYYETQTDHSSFVLSKDPATWHHRSQIAVGNQTPKLQSFSERTLCLLFVPQNIPLQAFLVKTE